MTDIDEIVQDFLLESFESLEQFDRDLVALEQDPTSTELLSEVFRILHTIKGTCGFLPFRSLEAVAHAGEELLSRLRRGDLRLDRDLADALLHLGDAIRSLLRSIESTGSEGDDSYADLLALLERLQADQGLRLGPDGSVTHVSVTHVSAANGSAGIDSAAHDSGVNGSGNGSATASTELPGLLDDDPGTPSETRAPVTDAKIRVNVDLLDSMMNLVGELVLTRNQLAQHAASEDDTDLRRLAQRLRLITGGLQEGVMQARMQPIDTVWSKLPRSVRDLSVQLGKTVRLVLEGRDTELDRTILEAIKDPLTHIVRNAIDHGIEAPAERAATGKPATGSLVLRAFHQGGLVNIEISDDGGGIDPGTLRRLAVHRGLLSADSASRLGDKESLALIFRPGFSTAGEVTSVSGRGVGMDVVKTNIERIGGLVEVESTAGRGTLFRIRIPLTLAIIPALVVATGGQRYLIPQASVQELVQLGESGGGRVEHAHGAAVYRLRGVLLPLVDLRRRLAHPPAPAARTDIVVLQSDGGSVGLVVDAIVGTEEVVVKPLGKQLRDISLYSGVTTMGDGEVALILDVGVLAHGAGDATSTSPEPPARPTRDPHDPRPDGSAAPEDPRDPAQRVPLLLVALVDGSRAALPLGAVRRLERIPVSSVDRVGTSYLVNYRDGLLPLVHAEDALATAPGDEHGQGEDGPSDHALTVVVCRIEEVTVGLVVADIIDITEGEPLSTSRTAHRNDRAAPVVIGGHVTEQLDLQDVLLAVDPHLLVHTTSVEALR